MRKWMLGFILSVVFIAMAMGPVQAIAFQTIAYQFDEYGNQTGGLTPIIGPDPTGGVQGNVLIYLLPQGVTVGSGDVRVFEPVATAVVLSDVLRFTDAAGNFFNFQNNDIYDTADRFIFYSDNSDGVDAPADVGFPVNVPTSYFDGGGVTEQGQEGANFFLYADTYYGISDGRLAVPEPTTMLLLGSGLLGLWGARRKFKK